MRAVQFIRLRDDRGRAHRWTSPPDRIVSLVPSDSYNLARLGAAPRLVGRTRYCVEPASDLDGIEVIGGTKDPDVDRIIELAPDVVIANREENTERDIDRLEAEGIRVHVSFPCRVAAGIAHLARLAIMLGRTSPSAKGVVGEAYRCHAEAEARRRVRPPVRVFVPIWMDPLMTIHGDTFISDYLDLVGAVNVFADRERRYPLAADLGDAPPLSAGRLGGRDVRYPRVTLDEVVQRKPDVVLLPDEPHDFTEADADVFRALETPAANCGRVRFVCGRDLMWPGARSVEGLQRVAALLEG